MSASLLSLYNKQYDEKIVAESQTKPVVLTSIEVKGADSLDNAFLKTALDPLLGQPLSTLGSTLKRSEQVEKHLAATGVFSEIKTTIDVGEGSNVSLDDLKVQPAFPVTARFSLVPVTANALSFTTSTADTSSGVSCAYANYNALGRAETVLVDAKLGFDPLASSSVDARSWNAKYMVPLVNDPSIRACFAVSSEQAKLESHTQNQLGLLFGLSKQCCNLGTILAGLSVVQRRVDNVAAATSDIIRRDTGNSHKTALVAQFIRDSRRFRDAFPVSGSYINVANEFAFHVNGENKSFNKAQIDLAKFVSHCADTFTAGFQASAGAICGDLNETHVGDRFFLGGNSLRGFEHNSVGQRDGKDFVGGSVFYKLGCSLSARLPCTPLDTPLRLQGWFNVGEVTDGCVFGSQAMATGVSLLYKSKNADLDITYSVPLSQRAQDITKPKISFGCSLNFL